MKSLQQASQSVKAAVFVLEEQERGVKKQREGGRETLPRLPQPSLVSLLFSLSGWYFSEPNRNSSVTVCSRDVWQGGTRQRYSRNAFLSGPLWGRWRGKPAKSLPPLHASKSLREPPCLQVPVTQSLEKHSFPLLNCRPLLSLSPPSSC